MDKKVMYVTGGTKGIGYGIAETLLKNGYAVAISGRKMEDAEEAAKKLREISNDILPLQSDVREYADEEKAVTAIVEKFGRLDGMIANAGMGIFKPVDQLTTDEWNQMIETNLTGVFHSLKACVEALKKSEGYFISISSLAGANFFEKGTGYNASKFGVVGFTQAAMLDLRPYNIKCTTIMPGTVASHFNGHTPDDTDGWKIQPEDIGEMVVQLLQMNPRVLPSKIEVRPTRPDLKP